MIGALLVAWFAFWLQRRHDRAKELQEAVEEYRAALTSMVTTWPLNSRRRSEPDLALDMPAFEAALQKAAKVSARCGWRDAALREGVDEIRKLVRKGIATWDISAPALGMRFLSRWIDTRRDVRRRKITVATLRPMVNADLAKNKRQAVED